MSTPSDPFRDARNESGILQCPFHGENITIPDAQPRFEHETGYDRTLGYDALRVNLTEFPAHCNRPLVRAVIAP